MESSDLQLLLQIIKEGEEWNRLNESLKEIDFCIPLKLVSAFWDTISLDERRTQALVARMRGPSFLSQTDHRPNILLPA
jgi:hypothetical protein